MSEFDDDQPLQPWIRAALLAEGLESGPSPDQRSRMAGKLALAVGVPVAALVAGSTIGGSAVAGAAGATTAGATGATTAAAGAATISTKAVALIVGALLVGSAGGITISELRHRGDAPLTLHSTSSAPPGRDISAPPAIDAAADSNPTDAPSDAAEVPLDAPVPAHAHATAPRPDAAIPSVTADQLSRERELIEVARSALRAGDTRLATKSLVEHELRFPSGKLTEERRALAIEVAIAKGDRAMATRLAADFRRDFPRSVFQTRIDDLLQ